MRRVALISAAIFLADQASKFAVVRGLDLMNRGEIDILPPFLNFRMAWNTGVNFGISAGVGFIALFGICVQNGVILIQEFNDNLHARMPLDEAIDRGVRVRIRPVVMTAMMASIGLLPAAMSTGIGSEAQRPLAIVIIGGLITATIFIMLVFPIVFRSLRMRTMRRKGLAPA